MRKIAVFYLLLISFQLCTSYKQITTRTSPCSPRSISKQRLYISLSEETTITLAQAAVNSAIVAALGTALFFQEKKFHENSSKRNKEFNDSLVAIAKINEEKRDKDLKNFQDILAKQDAAFKQKLIDHEISAKNKFGYNNLEYKRIRD